MSTDLGAYTARIQHNGNLSPSLETLQSLHLAHATHIPFENLDILLGRPIRIDPDNVWSKLVKRKRGGYCFEQNALFARVLEAVGFPVKRMAARVRYGAAELRPRTHMLLSVMADGKEWLADVGFGAEGLLLPLPLKPEIESQHFDWRYRLVHEGQALVLQSLRPEGWFDMYAFTQEEHHPIDYEVSNHYTSTFPQSTFVNLLVAQLPGPKERLRLVNRTLSVQRQNGMEEVALPDDDAIVEALRERFGLEFPPGTRFAYKDAVPPPFASAR